MINLVIRINNDLIELYPDTVFAKTIQAFDLFNVGVVKSNYTNKIKIPKTAVNKRVLQFVDDVKSTSRLPYNNARITVLQNGYEIISNGTVIIDSSDDGYSLIIYDGNYDFFNQIIGLNLSDIDLSSYDTLAWNDTAIKADSTAVNGIVHAFNDSEDYRWTGSDYFTEGNKPWPHIYLHTIFEKLFSTFGFQTSGNIFSNTFFKKLIIPLQNLYTDKFCSQFEFCAGATGGQTIINSISVVQFPILSLVDPLHAYDTVSSKYTVPQIHGNDILLHLNYASTLDVTVTGGTINIDLILNPVVGSPSSIATLTNKGTGVYTITTSQPDISTVDSYGRGDASSNQYWVRISTSSGTPTTTINSGTFYSKYPNNSPSTNWFRFQGSNPTSCFIPQYLLTDLAILDFIKEVSLLFGLVFFCKKGVIYIKNIDAIINDKSNFANWTTKRDPSYVDKIEYRFSNFAQTNVINWDNSADSNNAKTFCNGQFVVANSNLDILKEITSIFSSTKTNPLPINTKVWNCAKYGISTGTGTGYALSNTIGFRLLLTRDKYTTEPSIRVDGETITNYKVAYTIDARQADQLTWQNLLDISYTQFFLRLQNAKLITRYYNLTDIDIQNFNPLQLVYDTDSYYIVNKITDFTPDKVTKVELFKV